MTARDLTGKQFGRLTVTRPHASKGFWYTDCACGTKDKIVRTNSLMSGNTKSCGCLRVSNPGRPKKPERHPFITLDEMVINTFEYVNPIREFLRSKGVLVTRDSKLYINKVHIGDYKSPYHALAEAINRTVKGFGEK